MYLKLQSHIFSFKQSISYDTLMIMTYRSNINLELNEIHSFFLKFPYFDIIFLRWIIIIIIIYLLQGTKQMALDTSQTIIKIIKIQ